METMADPWAIYLRVARDHLLRGLESLGDEEFFWEPVPNCWSVRREDASAVGGDVVDGWVHERIPGEHDAPPFTTIAWRVVHLYRFNVMWHEYGFGAARRPFADVLIPSTASTAVDLWHESYDQLWRAFDGVGDDDLEREYEFPFGDPRRRRTLGGLLMNFFYENVHHGGEILCLRDLYRHRFASSSPPAP